MKSLKTILAAAALMVCGTVAAQTVYTDSEGNEYTFKKHAYLQLQGGAQYTLGESKFKDLLSGNANVALGWQFSPIFGARLGVGFWQSKGGYNGYQVDGTSAPGNIDYKWNYVAPVIDFTCNLTNLFWGYNPTRAIDFNFFLGGGANVGFGNDDANSICKQGYQMDYLWDGTQVLAVGRGGLAIDFKVSKSVALGLEANANILSDKYNSKKAGNADWYFNALASIKINLGKTYTKKDKPAPEPVVVEEPAPAPAPVVEEPAPAPVKETLKREVFFTINVSKVSTGEQPKVDDVVAYLNKYPEAKVAVTGYADKGTGTKKINARISEKRAQTVYDALIAAGISADRITKDSKGDTVQPFSENDLNRVTICVAE